MKHGQEPSKFPLIILFSLLFGLIFVAPKKPSAMAAEAVDDGVKRYDVELCFTHIRPPSGDITAAVDQTSKPLWFTDQPRGEGRYCTPLSFLENAWQIRLVIRMHEVPPVQRVELCMWPAQGDADSNATYPSQCSEIYPNLSGEYQFELGSATATWNYPVFAVTPH